MKNRQKKAATKKILAVISVVSALTVLGSTLVSNVNAVSDNSDSILDALGITNTADTAVPTVLKKSAPDIEGSRGDDFVLTPEIYFDIDEAEDIAPVEQAEDAEVETVSQESAEVSGSEPSRQEALKGTGDDTENTTEDTVIASDTPSISDGTETHDDLYWLARIICAESRGESLRGKIAVGNVVLNRVNSKNYPDTVYDVIFDTECGIQFTPTANGSIYNEPDSESMEAAKRCLEGESISDEIIYFINPAIASSTWVSDNRNYVVTIGNHEFYS